MILHDAHTILIVYTLACTCKILDTNRLLGAIDGVSDIPCIHVCKEDFSSRFLMRTLHYLRQ